MKINSKHLTVFPKARYIVTNTGNVKALGFNNVSKNINTLNISKQQRQYTLFCMIMDKGLEK